MSQSLSAAPPPPPPPPAFPKQLRKENCQNANGAVQPVAYLNNECCWASDHPELQKGCYLSRVCQQEPPKKCQYNNIPSMLQIGPTCGLVALSMLLNSKETTADQLYAEAVSQNFTINGEIFSAQFLYELTSKHLVNTVGACHLHTEPLNCFKVKECLQTGGCLLVPYPFSKQFKIKSI